jgi:hypothetical protein
LSTLIGFYQLPYDRFGYIEVAFYTTIPQAGKLRPGVCLSDIGAAALLVHAEDTTLTAPKYDAEELLWEHYRHPPLGMPQRRQ